MHRVECSQNKTNQPKKANLCNLQKGNACLSPEQGIKNLSLPYSISSRNRSAKKKLYEDGYFSEMTDFLLCRWYRWLEIKLKRIGSLRTIRCRERSYGRLTCQESQAAGNLGDRQKTRMCVDEQAATQKTAWLMKKKFTAPRMWLIWSIWLNNREQLLMAQKWNYYFLWMINHCQGQAMRV